MTKGRGKTRDKNKGGVEKNGTANRIESERLHGGNEIEDRGVTKGTLRCGRSWPPTCGDMTNHRRSKNPNKVHLKAQTRN